MNGSGTDPQGRESKPEHGEGRVRTTSPIQTLELLCPSCNEVLRHRVVHVRAGPEGEARRGGGGPLQGIARCSRCHLPHPFSIAPKTLHRVSVVVSEGPESVHTDLELPPEKMLELDGTLRVHGRPVRISRIEGPQARNLYRSLPEGIVTLWTVPTDELHLRVSVLERDRTRPLHLLAKGDQEFAVGDELRIDEERLEIVGLRGRGTTLREIGESLEAREVQRIYARSARSTRMPPGGRSAWRRSRVTPRS